MHKNRFSLLVLLSLFPGLVGCQSLQKAIFDDDCATTRMTFWDSEAEDDLPSPRLASEEALLWMKERDTQLLTARGSSLEDMEHGMHLAPDQQDWAMGPTQVFVPELLQREYFVKPTARDGKAMERRKPLFAQSRFGVEAASLDTPSFLPVQGLQARAINSAMSSYEVMPGDTLGTISKKLYGTPGRWMELAHLNHLGNGSLIFPKEILFYVKL